jgi:hypothetical protein
LIDIAIQGSILAAKWVVRCLDGCSPGQVLLSHHLLTAQHIHRIRGFFGLCDIISAPHSFEVSGSFLIRGLWVAWGKVAGLVQWKMSSSQV